MLLIGQHARRSHNFQNSTLPRSVRVILYPGCNTYILQLQTPMHTYMFGVSDKNGKNRRIRIMIFPLVFKIALRVFEFVLDGSCWRSTVLFFAVRAFHVQRRQQPHRQRQQGEGSEIRNTVTPACGKGRREPLHDPYAPEPTKPALCVCVLKDAIVARICNTSFCAESYSAQCESGEEAASIERPLT